MKFVNSYTQSCEIITTDEGDTLIRHDADTWEMVIGVTTEAITDPREFEEMYQAYLLYSR